MRWPRALALVLCLTPLACEQDPARAVKVAVPPAVAAAEAAVTPPTPEPRPLGDWRPEGCPPPPEGSSGPSRLTVTGPCAFEHRAAVSCEALFDDFIVTMTRKAANGATLMAYINVEMYQGPGDYQGAQMFVGVQDEKNIYRWSSDEVDITVGAGEASVILPATKLEGEPVLVDCTGPMTNFQCGGRADTSPIDGTVELVSGTLQCEPGKKKE